MSNTRAIIDYALNDNGKEVKEALYNEIHNRIADTLNGLKIEVAKSMFAAEEASCDMDDESKKKKLKKKKKEKEEMISNL